MSSVSSTTGFNLVRNFFKESFGDSYKCFVTLMKTHHQGEVRSGLAVECYKKKKHQSYLTFDTNPCGDDADFTMMNIISLRTTVGA